MSNIDISTSQKVVISFETANIRERITAFMIDMILLVLLLFVLFWIVFEVFDANESWGTYLLMFIPISFYSLFSELLMDGQSPGKRALGIKVVNINGLEPSLNDYLIRWSFRLVDIWFTLGAVAIMMIGAGDKGQRLGDMIANTTVIRKNNKTLIRLEQLESLKSIQDHDLSYKYANAFTEDEMMLVKEVLDRYSRFRNAAHKDALNLVAQRAAEKLRLDEVPGDKIKFLKTLIKDYIALSR